MLKKVPLIIIVLLAFIAGSCGSHKKTVVSDGGKKTGDIGQAAIERKVKGIDSKVASRIVKEAERWKGTPYRYGGKTRKGTDCSGMVMMIYQDVAGLKMPRSAAEQRDWCREVDRKKLAPGDLVFFTTSKKRGRVNHVGIYVGGGKFIHASSSRGVITSSLDEAYYTRHFHSCGRVHGIGEEKTVDVFEASVAAVEPSPVQPPEKKEKTLVVNAVGSVTLDELLKKKVPQPEVATPETVSDEIPDTVPVTMPAVVADSLEARADTIRDSVRRAMRF